MGWLWFKVHGNANRPNDLHFIWVFPVPTHGKKSFWNSNWEKISFSQLRCEESDTLTPWSGWWRPKLALHVRAVYQHRQDKQTLWHKVSQTTDWYNMTKAGTAPEPAVAKTVHRKYRKNWTQRNATLKQNNKSRWGQIFGLLWRGKGGGGVCFWLPLSHTNQNVSWPAMG